MTKKRLIIILSIVAIVLLGLFIALILTRGPQMPGPLPEPLGQNDVTGGDKTPEPVLPQVIESSNPQTETTSAENGILSVGRNFSERFATYSSDNQFSNLKEVKVYASARMSNELETMIQGNPVSESFIGVTSKALSLKIISFNESQGSAKVSASLQREETREGQLPRVYYQTLVMDLIASGNNWLVDKIAWQ